MTRRSVILLLYVAGLYLCAGQCHSHLGNQAKAILLLKTSVRIDVACVEAAEILANDGLLTGAEKRSLLAQLNYSRGRDILVGFYR